MKNHKFIKILNDLKKKNVAIMGHMGSGKSVIGKIIAKKNDLSHIDIDNEIVSLEGESINNIFSKYGEKYFRKIEKKVILSNIKKNNMIISLGGGSILDNLIRKELKKNSLTLFLDISISELTTRLIRSKNRPLLKNVNIKEKIKELDIDRRKYYLQADIIVKNATSPLETYKKFYFEFLKLNEKENNS